MPAIGWKARWQKSFTTMRSSCGGRTSQTHALKCASTLERFRPRCTTSAAAGPKFIMANPTRRRKSWAQNCVPLAAMASPTMACAYQRARTLPSSNQSPLRPAMASRTLLTEATSTCIGMAKKYFASSRLANRIGRCCATKAARGQCKRPLC